jgi:predicted membrane chloride channel (bestrophin family)
MYIYCIFFPIHLVCEIAENGNGMSILIDGTLRGLTDIRNMLQLHSVPYYNFDFSIQSFVKMMESYIIAQNAQTDAVFILQDEKSNLCYVYIFAKREK